MNDQQLQLVTFEQARRLKKLGFNWPVHEKFNLEGMGGMREHYTLVKSPLGDWNHPNWNGEGHVEHDGKENYVSCPETALALKWFRDVKRMFFRITYFFIESKNSIAWVGLINTKVETSNCDTYEAAESALLDALIEQAEKEALT